MSSSRSEAKPSLARQTFLTKAQCLDSRSPSYKDDLEALSYALSAPELRPIVQHFQKKHNIKIIVNGQTEEGLRQLSENRATLAKQIAELKNEDSKYSQYLRLIRCSELGDENYNKIIKLINPYIVNAKKMFKELESLNLNKLGRHYIDLLSEEELIQLNKLCNNSDCKTIFDNAISSHIKKLMKEHDNKGLRRDQCFQEMTAIQASLAQDEVVGYIYTNRKMIEATHCEVAIVMKDKLIKPVSWNTFPSMEIEGQAYLFHFHKTIIEKSVSVYPQSGGMECATLGLLYLKELLKNNAQQLRNFSLSFTYYSSKNRKNLFFLPSPHVLRYSQSGTYNWVVSTLLKLNSELEIIKVPGKATYSVVPLQAILQKSLRFAQEIQDEKCVAHHQALLKKLPEFSKIWLAEFEKMQEKRRLMQVDGSFNFYLAYRTNSMKKIAQSQSLVGSPCRFYQKSGATKFEFVEERKFPCP